MSATWGVAVGDEVVLVGRGGGKHSDKSVDAVDWRAVRDRAL